MAENQNISTMAELIFNDIFSIFKWKKSGPSNKDWACINSKTHNGRKTHPSDVVFYYDEAYSSSRSYINVDLKSYAKGTITVSKVENAISNLIDSVDCANSSPDWQSLYTHDGKNLNVHGLLFIYNNDGEYDSDFHKVLTKIKSQADRLPESSRVFVFGPKNVCYLNSIAIDLQLSLRSKKIDDEDYEFFYPDLQRKANVLPAWTASATIEMISSPYIFVKYKNSNEAHDIGLIVYYSRLGENREEFMYLIDLLFSFQVFQNASEIEIKMVFCSPIAVSQFQKAKDQYLESFGQDAIDLSKRLQKIKISTVKNVVRQFSEVEIGMRDV